MKKTFDPADLFEEIKQSGFDPSLFENIDERDIPAAPNFLTWVTGQKFLNTTILPRQVEMGTKLFLDYCPKCSNPRYIDKLFDQTIGNIKDNIVFLEFGKCPKCGITRYELVKSKIFKAIPNEVLAVLGQRCVPATTLINTNRGIIPIKDVRIGDLCSHGVITKKFYSGTLPQLKLKTTYNWTLSGARDSHIIPCLTENFDIIHKPINECKIGDAILLYSANTWSELPPQLPPFERKKIPHGHTAKDFNFPTEVTPELARLVGYLISDGQYTRKYNARIVISNEDVENDVIRCVEAVFGEKPQVEEQRKCKLEGFKYKCLTINGVSVMEWLNSIGLTPVKKRDKFIPEFIMNSPKTIVCEFLAGLFGGDGNLYMELNGSIRLQYTSVSKILIKQLRLLLLNMGIITRCDKLKSNGFGKSNSYGVDNIRYGEESYFLSTKDSEYVEIFKQNVALVEKKKVNILDQNICRAATRYYKPKNGYVTKSGLYQHLKLEKLVNLGYTPVRIESIEEDIPCEMYDIQVPDTNVFVGDGFLHHNSGKTKFVGLVSTYQDHRFLKIPNPLRFFNMPSGEILMGTFSALTLEQASQTLWEAYKGFKEASPWFQNYHTFLKSEEKRLSIELLHILKHSYTYIHKHLLWHCTGSEGRKMRGRTRIFAAIDELGWMTSDETKQNLTIMNADDVYTALSNSLATMRMKYAQLWNENQYDMPPAIMANISSPSAVKDKAMRLLKEAPNNPKMLGFHLPTWECNPDYTYKTLREEYATMDQAIFDRDFGAEPPLAANPYLADPRLVSRIATGQLNNSIIVQEIIEKDQFNEQFKTVKTILDKKDKTVSRMITFDLGYKKNALAATLFSIGPDSKPQLEFAVQLVPTENVTVNIARFFDDFTMPLVEAFNIKHAFFDRWQSLDQIQRLREKGVDAQQYSLTYKDMDSVRGAIMSQGIVIPTPPMPVDEIVRTYKEKSEYDIKDAVSSLCLQLLIVRDEGHRMLKPLKGNDDLFRAFCLGALKIMDQNIRNDYTKKTDSSLVIKPANRAVGVIRRVGEMSGGGYNGPSLSIGVVRSRSKR